MKKYFNIDEVGKGIWSIAGVANEQMYLVTGTEKAMLVDTGMGIGDLASVVSELTILPIIIVNTHGHPDHAGGNSNFSEVWLPEKDLEIMQRMCTTAYRLDDIKAANGENNPAYQHMVNGLVETRPITQKYLSAGQVVDLGGRQFEVLDVPGHTPGSLCLVNYEEQILFSGDTIVATPVWIYLKHSLPLHIYHQSLLKLKELGLPAMKILPGHPPIPLDSSHLHDLIICCEEITHDPHRGVFTKTFAGEGYQWTHGKGMIIYDPERI
jgi:hydroxyacylglutathione hydrolase